MKTIHIGVVEHRHGTNVYAGGTIEELKAKVLEYVEDNAELEKVTFAEGMTGDDKIAHYFNAVEDESCLMDRDDIAD